MLLEIHVIILTFPKGWIYSAVSFLNIYLFRGKVGLNQNLGAENPLGMLALESKLRLGLISYI